MLLTALGVLFAFLAWKASIPVLSWVLVFVGGFVALVVGTTTVAVAYQDVRERASRSP